MKSSLSTLIITLFVFLFTYTAISKTLEHNLFRITLLQSPLLSDKAEFISWFVPCIELATAAMLLFKATQRIGMYISLTLMIGFSAYVFYLLLFIPNLPCSCGGIIQSLSWNQHFLLNLLLSSLALFEILLHRVPVLNNKIFTS